MENVQSDQRKESKDPREFADYLRSLNDPVQIVREGKNWLDVNGVSISDGIDVVSVMINNISSVLRTISK